MRKITNRLMISTSHQTFSQHHRCWWCEFPLPDCCCPISRIHVEASNDNEVEGAKYG